MALQLARVAALTARVLATNPRREWFPSVLKLVDNSLLVALTINLNSKDDLNTAHENKDVTPLIVPKCHYFG
jgi:hypothetical protein